MACCIVGSFGVVGGGVSVLQLLVASVILAGWLVVGAQRRRAELSRRRWIRAGLAYPHQAVTVRRLDA